MVDYPKEPWRRSLTRGRLDGGSFVYGICSDPTNINVAWVTGALKSSDEVLDRICAAVNFCAGFPTEALEKTSLGQVEDVLAILLEQAEVYESGWVPLSDACDEARALLATLQEKNDG